jgi:toxin ParE1/3/4
VGRQRPELAPGLRSFPIGNYVLFYLPLPNGIDLVRVRSRYLDIEPDNFKT